jgi:membrane protein required for colicin V production
MTVLDFLVLLVVSVSVVSGTIKGIIRVVVSVAFAVAGLVLAAHLYAYAAAVLRVFASAWLANLLGFIAVFLVVVAAGGFLSWRLRGALKRARMSWMDHTLGGVLGLVRGWLICSVVYLALTAFPLRPDAVEQAYFSPVLLEGTRVVAYLTSSELRERFFNGTEIVTKLWQEKRK